jgi:hypothetical protein
MKNARWKLIFSPPKQGNKCNANYNGWLAAIPWVRRYSLRSGYGTFMENGGINWATKLTSTPFADDSHGRGRIPRRRG